MAVAIADAALLCCATLHFGSDFNVAPFLSRWRRGEGREGRLVVCIELPYHRLGLLVESAHSLRLGPGCTVVVKAVIPDAPHDAAAALATDSSGQWPSGHRKLVVPRASFHVYRAVPEALDRILAAPEGNGSSSYSGGGGGGGSGGGGDHSGAADDLLSLAEHVPEVTGLAGDFRIKWSLEQLLNRLFLNMLAVESPGHLPSAVVPGSSLAYVRELRRTGAPDIGTAAPITSASALSTKCQCWWVVSVSAIDNLDWAGTEDYMLEEHSQILQEALTTGTREALTGPRVAPESAAADAAAAGEAATNHLLRLAMFVRQQVITVSPLHRAFS